MVDLYFPPSTGVSLIAEPCSFFVSSAFSLAVNIISKEAVACDCQDQAHGGWHWCWFHKDFRAYLQTVTQWIISVCLNISNSWIDFALYIIIASTILYLYIVIWLSVLKILDVKSTRVWTKKLFILISLIQSNMFVCHLWIDKFSPNKDQEFQYYMKEGVYGCFSSKLSETQITPPTIHKVSLKDSQLVKIQLEQSFPFTMLF